ncbi:MAG: S8 family serine peptidase [Acidobacteriota bacterium]
MRKIAACVAVLPLWTLAAPSALGAEEASDAGPTRLVALHSRTFTPAPGVDPALYALAQDRSFIHVIAQMPAAILRPPAMAPRSGVHWAGYLRDSTFLLRIDLDSAPGSSGGAAAESADRGVAERLEGALERTGALAFAPLEPADKAPRSLLDLENLEPWTFENGEGGGRLRVLISFFPGVPADQRAKALASLGLADEALEDAEAAGSPNQVAAVIEPYRLEGLLAEDAVEFVEPGPEPRRPLMERTRLATGAEAAQQIDDGVMPPSYAAGLSGDGVRVSNSEGLNVNHDDFWNHDSSGARTTPRWLGCPSGNGGHGTMTAGIILGNGFMSSGLAGDGSANGGAPYEYRGMAPEALFDCYTNDVDLSNHSFTQSHSYGSAARDWDLRIWGGGSNGFHPHIGAAGNEGIHHQYGNPDDRGYYSTWRNSKNELVVGMLSDENLGWTGSSVGPSLDGRLKPEISAPGTRHFFPADRNEAHFEIDSVVLRRGGLVEQSWTFDSSGAGWRQGWGEVGWWDRRYVGPISQSQVSGSSRALKSSVRPYKTHWALLGTTFQDDGTTPLSLSSHPSHRLEIRYRYDSVDRWNNLGARARLGWTVVTPGTNDYTDYYAYRWDTFPIVTDGQWHVATVDIGANPEWSTAAGEIIDILQIYPIRDSGQRMRSVGMNQNYQGSGGSSAAAPVVTGAAALLLDQMKDDFGVVLGDHSASPFWRGQTAVAGSGVPLPSTLRALLVHGARDLAKQPFASDLNNPDTQEPTRYFKGPDEVTGYGIVDVAESSRVLAAHSFQSPRVVERELSPAESETLTFVVPAGRQPEPLKVTLAWDDPPGSALLPQDTCRLINDLDLRLISPSNVQHEPWDLQPPSHYPAVGQTPPSEIRPAVRRDNDCDNLEQISIDAPEAGIWEIRVRSKGIFGPTPPSGCWETSSGSFCQRYSLIVGSPPLPSEHLSGGKVVFTSDRVQQQGVDSRQLFVQAVGSTAAPQQLTADPFPARFPEWSHDGRYIAYVTSDILVGGGGPTSVLRVIDAAGNLMRDFYPYQLLGQSLVMHPSWSRDGRKIVFTSMDGWGGRRLGVLEFSAPYDFQSATPSILVNAGIGAMDGVFSPDGRTVYFDAWEGEVHRVPASGGDPTRLFGDGVALKRSFDLSISPDGHSLLMNSERYKDAAPGYRDEEVVELQLREAVSYQRTQLDGHQYASYALGGSGEFVSQSTSSAGGGGRRDLYLQENGVRQPLFIGDPGNQWNDDDPHWFKAAPPGLSVPSVKNFCRDADAVLIAAEICSFASEPRSFGYAFTGHNAGPGCSIGGPTDFAYLDADPVVVAANGCETVRVRVARPGDMTSNGQTACYTLRATDLGSGVEVETRGTLRDARNSCAVVTGGGGGETGAGPADGGG